MTDHDAWLAANTIQCQRFNSKVTPTVCERYQAVEPARCKGCARAGDVAPIDQVERARMRRHKVSPTVGKIGICVKCKKSRKIVAKGECGGCYNSKYAPANNARQKEYRALAKEALAAKSSSTSSLITINLTIAPADAAELLNFIAGLKPLVGGAA